MKTRAMQFETLEGRDVPAFVGAPAVPVTFGGTPLDVAVGDLNGDGKADFVTANVGFANNASVRLGNGDGTFRAAKDVALGGQPEQVELADLNRDGKLDLVATLFGTTSSTAGGNTVSVRLGNGNGTFGSLRSFTVGTRPAGLVVGDFNRDGRLDLATANLESNTVSILLGNGNGTFRPRQDVAAGTTPAYLVGADLDGDGDTDLATSNRDTGGVSILTNNGAGSFTRTAALATGSYTLGVTAADFNGDGRVDLAAANGRDDTITLLLNDGGGTFSASEIATGRAFPGFLAAGDVNRDGKADLIATNLNTDGLNRGNVAVRLGNGDGTFQSPVTLPTGRQDVALADLNGDGYLDLLAPQGFFVNVYLNDRTWG